MLTPELFEYFTFWQRGSTAAPSRTYEQLVEDFDNDPHLSALPDLPWPSEARPDPLMETKLSTELGRAMEDYVSTIIDSWDELRQATAYLYLNKSGMTLDRARQLRVKAGLSD